MPTLFELYQNIIRESPFAQANEVALRALLCEIQGLIEMSDFYLKKDEEIKDLPTFLSYLARFLNGEPYQYIIQKARFINRDFFVDNRVLIPRMETEEVVYKAIELIRDSNNSSSLSIADLGSGSGIIAITLKKTFPHSQVFASDTSKDAIAVAKINAEKFGADISFFRGDVLEPFIFSGIKLDFLISNPPYITNIQEIDSGVIEYEPYSALVDKDELGFYKKVFSMYKAVAKYPFTMIFEIGHDMKDKIGALLRAMIPLAKWEIIKDINGQERILSIQIEK